MCSVQWALWQIASVQSQVRQTSSVSRVEVWTSAAHSPLAAESHVLAVHQVRQDRHMGAGPAFALHTEPFSACVWSFCGSLCLTHAARPRHSSGAWIRILAAGYMTIVEFAPFCFAAHRGRRRHSIIFWEEPCRDMQSGAMLWHEDLVKAADNIAPSTSSCIAF